MSKRLISLADVARAAGVGKATASRALRGNPQVGAATRARILETAAELGYRPRPAAQALRTGRTGLVELSVPGRLDPELVPILFHACEERGYHLLLTRPALPGPAITPMPVVDARIMLDPDAGGEDADVPTKVLRTSGLAAGDRVAAALSVVDDLIGQLEGGPQVT